jgi:type IV pilus assembly protein PilF
LLTALVQNPSSAETHDAMAYFLEQTGDPQNAQKYYLKAIALGPQQGAPLNNYGAFLCRQGQYQQAEDYFLRAIADPNYINTASAYENAGLCATLIPNWKKAAFYLEKALAKEPNRLGALYELSRIKERQHDTLQAQRYLARYLTLTREHPHKAALQLAYKLAHQLHQKQKARHYARLLKQHFPQDPITPMRG